MAQPQLPPEEQELAVVSSGAGVPQLPVLQLPELEEDDVLQQPMGIYPYIELFMMERQRPAGIKLWSASGPLA